MPSIADSALQLAAQLDAAGHASASASLIDSVGLASTGSELLMGLRWNLRRVATDTPGVEPALRSRAGELLARVEAALAR